MDGKLKECWIIKDRIVHLPMEDTCWCITDDNSPGSEEQQLRKMSVVDISDLEHIILHSDKVLKSEMSYTEQAMELFYHACLHPTQKGPRKPRVVKLGDTPEAKGAILDLTEFGVLFYHSQFQKEQLLTMMEQNDGEFRRCFSCGRRATSDFFVPCSYCEAVLFCDEECQAAALRGRHKSWCKKFKKYMEMEEELGKFPFCFNKDTTDQNFNQEKLRRFLTQHGVYDKGLWRRECPPPGKAYTAVAFGELQSPDRPYVLSLEDAALADPPPNPGSQWDNPLKDWSDYYNYRGFWFDSPITGLLHYPLTLYWIVSHCLPKHYPAMYKQMKERNSLQVHILGAEKEAEMFTPFLECARLLVPVNIHIHLFGDELSKDVHNNCLNKENLSFHLHRGLYHENDPHRLSHPDLVVGFNAGLSAYHTFMPTMQMLLNSTIPLYCTDYCYYSIVHSKKALHQSRTGTVLKPVINPFRSPFRLVLPEMNLPCYSNAFVYHVKPYKETKAGSTVPSNQDLFMSDIKKV